MNKKQKKHKFKQIGIICEGSIFQFKAFLNNEILSFFNIGNRIEQKHHCRLRLKSSSLTSRLFSSKSYKKSNSSCGQLRVWNTFYYTALCIMIFDVVLQAVWCAIRILVYWYMETVHLHLVALVIAKYILFQLQFLTFYFKCYFFWWIPLQFNLNDVLKVDF